MATTAIGSNPSYITLSDNVGARRLEIEPTMWSASPPSGQWRADQYFLDAMLRAGDTFIFSSNPRLARPGSWFFRELRYLLGRGKVFIRLPPLNYIDSSGHVSALPPHYWWGC